MSSQAQREAVWRNQTAKLEAGGRKVGLWFDASTLVALEEVARARGLSSMTATIKALALEATHKA